MGDVFFDLANFSINNDLDEDGRRVARRLLRDVSPADERALELMRSCRAFARRCGALSARVSELDFDFGAYADEHFAAEALAAEPAFGRRSVD